MNWFFRAVGSAVRVACVTVLILLLVPAALLAAINEWDGTPK